MSAEGLVRAGRDQEQELQRQGCRVARSLEERRQQAVHKVWDIDIRERPLAPVRELGGGGGVSLSRWTFHLAGFALSSGMGVQAGEISPRHLVGRF